MEPVASITRAMLSGAGVMKSSGRRTQRIGITAGQHHREAGEDRAGATKYGGKIVACQTGDHRNREVEADDVCTETTSGVEARSEQQVRRLVAVPVPRTAASQPSASMP